jgi:hypothetical protein
MVDGVLNNKTGRIMSKVAMTLEDITSLVTHASRNDTFQALTDILFQWAEQANNEIAKLRIELDNYKKASAFCEKHIPSGGARGYCVVCTGQKLSAALSAISYACEEPNEYQVSSYDLLYDEDAVVEQVKRKLNKA